nr:zinc finger, CCHC-type [Tanacetum cinerariifolium]
DGLGITVISDAYKKMEDTQGGLLLASDRKSHGCKRRDQGRGRESKKSRDVSNPDSNLHLVSELVHVKGLKGSMSYQVLVLTSTNYPVWAVKVKSIMDAHGLWQTVEPGTLGEEPNVKKSKQALAFLFQAIPEDMVLHMANSVKRLFDSMPKSLLQIVASIKQCFVLDSMLFDEAVGRLKAYVERIKGAEKMEDTQGGLLLASDRKSHGCLRVVVRLVVESCFVLLRLHPFYDNGLVCMLIASV